MPDDAKRTDPHVERLRPDPSQPPQSVVVLEGLLGDSDRKGFRRLYFTPSLTYYAEFRAEDVVYTEAVPAEQPPMQGLDSSRVAIGEGAAIEYTRTTTAKPVDEFDLDVRVAAPQATSALGPRTFRLTICRDTCATDCVTRCGEDTCQGTCETRCRQATCPTGETRCQHTCQITCTCQTQCGQDTCALTCTCRTNCNQQTCDTCRTRCDEPTCDTCQRTCFPGFTCNNKITCWCAPG